jgi:hypothetical protein
VTLGAVAVVGYGCGDESGEKSLTSTRERTAETERREGRVWDGDGFEFTYPSHWERYEEESTEFGGATELSSVLLSPPNTSDASVFNLTTYDVQAKVTEDNIDEFKDEIAAPIEEIAEASDGVVSSGPVDTTLAGLPGYRFELDLRSRGVSAHATITTVFDGSIEYFLYCQYTKDDAAKLRAGCAQIYESLQVD